MPIAVFSNICTPIGLVNRARYIFIGIISNNDGMFDLQPVDNYNVMKSHDQSRDGSNLIGTILYYNLSRG